MKRSGAALLVTLLALPSALSAPASAANAVGEGFRPGSDIFNYGVPFYGSPATNSLAAPLVGIAATPTGKGYWLLGRDGGIFSYGDATFHGSTGAMRLNQPVVGMAADPKGRGYWFVAADGGIFSFDTPFHGSTGALRLSSPIVGMAPTATGNGYWLVARDGGVFSFGDAAFAGSPVGKTPKPFVGIAADTDGAGYYLLADDGAVWPFDAPFYGDSPSQGYHTLSDYTAIAARPGGGYWVALRYGSVRSFGNDTPHFETSGAVAEFVAGPFPGDKAFVPFPAVGLAASPDGKGVWSVVDRPLRAPVFDPTTTARPEIFDGLDAGECAAGVGTVTYELHGRFDRWTLRLRDKGVAGLVKELDMQHRETGHGHYAYWELGSHGCTFQLIHY